MSEHERNNRITKADIILIAVLLLAALAGLFLLKNFRTTGAYADIMVDGTSVKKLSLEEDISYTLTLDAGTNTIVVKDGTVSVERADCPDKICVEHKPIRQTGETIICLPHKLVVEIKK